MQTSGMYSTDTGVYYAHTRDAGGDVRPLRRHEQRVSSKKVCFAMVMIPLLRVHASRMHSIDTNVYYAHVRDAGGDLRPLRRHEQNVSTKKVCFAMLSLHCDTV
jgi:hypothetical protein